MGETAPEVIYRAEEDILVLRFGEPRAAITLEMGDGTLARIDPDTGELVGFEILRYRERAAQSEQASPSPQPRPRNSGRFLPRGLVPA